MMDKYIANDAYHLYCKQKLQREMVTFFILLAYLSYFILPISSELIPKMFRYLLYFLVPAYALHINMDYSKRMNVATFKFLICICCFIIAFYYAKWKATTSLSEYFFEVFFFWLPLLFFEQIMELPHKLKRKLRIVFWVLLAVAIATTAVGNIRYPEASRELASYTPLASLYRKKNIGDYHFVYGTVLLVPYVLYEIRNATFGGKILFFLLLGALLSLVVITQYAIAIIIFVAETAIVIIMRAKNKSTMVVKCALAVAIVLLIKDEVPNWLLSLRTFFEDNEMTSLAERCTMISNYLIGKGASGDMANRGDLYLMSWLAFCDSPLLGKLSNGAATLGGHSEILDILGGTGIVGFLLFLFCLMFYVRKIKSCVAKENLTYVLSSFAGLIVLFSVNTGLFPFVGIAGFIAAPLIFEDRKC